MNVQMVRWATKQFAHYGPHTEAFCRLALRSQAYFLGSVSALQDGRAADIIFLLLEGIHSAFIRF